MSVATKTSLGLPSNAIPDDAFKKIPMGTVPVKWERVYSGRSEKSGQGAMMNLTNGTISAQSLFRFDFLLVKYSGNFRSQSISEYSIYYGLGKCSGYNNGNSYYDGGFTTKVSGSPHVCKLLMRFNEEWYSRMKTSNAESWDTIENPTILEFNSTGNVSNVVATVDTIIYGGVLQ